MDWKWTVYQKGDHSQALELRAMDIVFSSFFLLWEKKSGGRVRMGNIETEALSSLALGIFQTMEQIFFSANGNLI